MKTGGLFRTLGRAGFLVCFTGGLWLWPAALRAAPNDQLVYLTVKVVDETGKEVSGARINVYQANSLSSTLSTGAFRAGVVVPPDYSEPTTGQGLARITIRVPSGQKLDLAIEVAREDMKSESRDIKLGTQFPTRLPLQTFILKKKTDAGAGPIITVAIDVQDEKYDPIEGASVIIRDTSLGAATGRFPGVSGSGGRATISVLYGSADREETLPVEVSKGGYKNTKIYIDLKQNQVGKTVLGGTAVLEKAAANAAKVIVTVTDAKSHKGIGDATVILDNGSNGYHSEKTNASGTATFLVGQTGTFAVRISQDYYRPGGGELRLLQDEQEKSVPFELEPKATKDEGEDTIEITVLAKDPTDEKAKPSPLAGANVKAGTISAPSGSNGVAILQGAFEERQEVLVDAPGYKNQRRVVSVNKILHYSAGKGSATITLDPELSESSPIRVIVEVVDPAGGKVKNANVDFHSANGTLLGGGSTKEVGSVDFRNSDSPGTPLSELRKGITVSVKATGYQGVLNRSVPSNLLQPSLEAGRFTVELKQDWSELIKAITAIEGRVGALRAEIRSGTTKGQSLKLLAAKSIATLGRVESSLKEIKAARDALDKQLSGIKCAEAKKLAQEIEALQKEAEAKEKAFTKLLEEATGLVANCTTQAQGAAAAEKYRNAIKLIGEMGKVGSKTNELTLKLNRYAEAMKDGGTLLKKVEQTVSTISNEVRAAEKDAGTASSDYNDAFSVNLNLPGKRAALKSDYARLKTNFKLSQDYSELPKDLAARLVTLDQTLSEAGTDASLQFSTTPDLTRIDDVIKPNLTQMRQTDADADALLGSLKGVLCQVDSRDSVVEDIRTRIANAGFELGLAADLPNKARACGGGSPTPTPSATATPTPSLSATPTPSPSVTPSPSPNDEVIVPDISIYGSPKSMKGGAGPDLVGKIIAISATPPPGTTKPFASQDPPALSKAKRGSVLKIFVYQSLLQPATPTPSPTPTPARTTGMPNLVGLTLDQAVTRLPANMRIGSDEIGDPPKTPELALTIFDQYPTATSPVDAVGPVVVTVKRYGSAQATLLQRFDGTYVGRYKGDDSGAVRFTISGGTITILSPGSGTGQISANGSANFSGAGRDASSSYSFDGTFSVDAKGKATARGNWSGTQSGYSGSGTWSAARP